MFLRFRMSLPLYTQIRVLSRTGIKKTSISFFFCVIAKGDRYPYRDVLITDVSPTWQIHEPNYLICTHNIHHCFVQHLIPGKQELPACLDPLGVMKESADDFFFAHKTKLGSQLKKSDAGFLRVWRVKNPKLFSPRFSRNTDAPGESPGGSEYYKPWHTVM